MKSLEKKLELPPVIIRKNIPINTYRGSSSYGAMNVASSYCNINYKPWMLNFLWQHGCIPPWQNIDPIAVTFGVNRNEHIFVARKDQELYLQMNGYPTIKTIGLPFCYIPNLNENRLGSSLLVMPPHVLNTQEITEKKTFKNYVEYVESIRNDFDLVVACISQNCITKGYWVRDFQKIGVQVIRGAHPHDMNALYRQKMMYSKFETVTSSNYGSHIPYALDSGCKVSISGPYFKWNMEQIMKDSTWKQIPEKAYKLIIEDEYGLKSVKELQKFKVKPIEAMADRSYGSFLLGRENKISSEAMKQAFRWSSPQIILPYMEHLRNKIKIRTRLKQLFR